MLELRGLPWVAFALFATVAGCSSSRKPLVVFHAASLSRVLHELEQAFESEHPGLDVRLEPSGSQVAARKISELGRRADLVLVADWRVIERLLVPHHATWQVRFATNELVLAYGSHSPGAAELSPNDWPRVLLEHRVRLGRADESLAPIGYQTLQCWKLAERYYHDKPWAAGLASRLAGLVRPEDLVPDVAELASKLQARAIDYAFLFRSVAEEHRMQYLRLPTQINLGDPALESHYAGVSVTVKMKGKTPRPLRAAPVCYGATIPEDTPNPGGAAELLYFLLSPAGHRLLERSGFAVVDPPDVLPHGAALPGQLAGLAVRRR